jgi:hypothetical protein
MESCKRFSSQYSRPAYLNFHCLLRPLCIFNNFIQSRVVAQKTVPKGQCMGAVSWALLDAFGKVRNPDFNHPAIFQAPQGFYFFFRSSFRHGISPKYWKRNLCTS